MKKFTDWYQSSALVVGALTLMAIAYYQRKEIVSLKDINKQYEIEVKMIQGGDIQKENMMDSMQSVVDSMYAENLINEIELNRYKVAYEIFLERNRKAAEEYGTIISNETE
jgi:hypothetical protein